jgi:hypothetical protein
MRFVQVCLQRNVNTLPEVPDPSFCLARCE